MNMYSGKFIKFDGKTLVVDTIEYNTKQTAVTITATDVITGKTHMITTSYANLK